MSLRPPNWNQAHRRAMSVMSFETLVSVLIDITDELDSFPSSFKVGGILYNFGHMHIDVNVILGPRLLFKEWNCNWTSLVFRTL